MYLFFQGLHSLQIWSLHGYIAGGIDVLFADILFLGLDGRCRKRVFGKSIDNGNIHSCFCKFAFLKLFAIAADCLRTQNWEAKKEVYIKSRKIRNRIVELLRKFACICTPCLCFCVASSGMGKKLLFLKKVLPLDCCMFQVGLITFITCFCALRLSLAVSTSLANKIRLRLSARKKPIVKISYLQEIKSSRDIL